jgi:orotidine-5'-phosphate decarboxylase
MKYLLLLLIFGRSTTVPVKRNFPEVPERLMQKCPQLQKINEDAKLSDIAKTVTNNYTTYYECAVKDDAWIEWYQLQKHIFESVK